MSTEIDQKVVQMKFDNKSFEQNISTSMSSIDKLKQKLKFDKANTGIDGVNKSISNVNMAPLSSAVDAVGVKFNALQVIAATALANVTNSVMNAGKKIVKEFTIEPITTGFDEYETQLNAVQTILANTQGEGATLGKVNKALDTLNAYSDKTIYNFTEMTRNIGTFTAAGVGLDDSVSAIKGIANLAAVSGSNSQQASTAMYQLSQALAAGRVSLQDWNSVVNAGMGGKVFQDALKRTAKAMGVAVDESESFRESIGGGDSWLSADILTATLSQFTGDLSDAQLKAQGFNKQQIKDIQEQAKMANDAATKVKTFTQLMDTMKESVQSGWGQTFRTILGDFEESKEFFTNISNGAGEIIGQMNDSRNKLLTDGLSSGWKRYLNEGIIDEEGYIGRIKKLAYERKLISKEEMESISSYDDLQEHNLVTSKLLGDGLNLLTEDYNKLSEEEKTAMGITQEQIDKQNSMNNAYKIGARDLGAWVKEMGKSSGRDNIIDALSNSFKALQSILKPIKQAFYEVFEPLKGSDIYDFTVLLKKFTEGLILSDEAAETVKSVFKALFSVFKKTFDVIGYVVGVVGKLVGSLKPMGSIVGLVVKTVADFVTKLMDFSLVADGVDESSSWIIKGLTQVKKIFEEFLDLVTGGLSSISLDNIKGVIDKIKTGFTDLNKVAKDTKENVGPAVENIVKGFNASELKNGISMFKEFFKTIMTGIVDSCRLLISSTLDVLKTTDFEQVFDLIYTSALGVFAIKLKKFVDAFKAVNPITSFVGNITDMLGSITTSINNTFSSVQDTMKAYQKNLKAKSLTSIALAILALAGAIFLVSKVPPDRLLASTGAILALMTGLLIAMKIYSKIDTESVNALKVNATLFGMCIAIYMLVGALKKISALSPQELLVGIGGLTGIVALLCVMMHMLSKRAAEFKIGSKQLIMLSATMLVMSKIVKEIGSMPWQQALQGIGGIFALMTILVLGINLFRGTDRGCKEMITAAAALTILMIPLKIMAAMPLEKLAQGIGGLAAAMAILAVGLMAFKNTKEGAGAMVIAALALNLLLVPLAAFAFLPLTNLAQGIGVLAITLAILGKTLNSFSRSLPGASAMIVAAVAINMLVVPLALLGALPLPVIGKGLLALGGALGIMAITLTQFGHSLPGVAALVVAAAAINMLVIPIAALGKLSMPSIGKALLAIAGALGIFIGAVYLLGPAVLIINSLSIALLAFGGTMLAIGVAMPLIALGINGIAVGILALAAALTASVGVIVLGITAIVLGFVKLVEVIAVAIVKAIASFLRTLATMAPDICKSITTIVIAVVESLALAIPSLAKTLVKFIIEILDVLVDNIGPVCEKLVTIILTIMQKLAERMPELVKAGVDIFVALLVGIANGFKDIDQTVLLDCLKGVGFITAILGVATAWILLGPLALVGCVAAALAVTAITGLVAGLGLIACIPGLTWLVDKGLGLLELIAGGIGRVIGAFMGGMEAAKTEQMPQMGTNLSLFMTNLQGFIDGANSIKEDAIDGVGRLVGIVTAISGASLLEGIASFITGSSSIDKFSADIIKFGNAIVEYSKVVSGNIDANAVTATATAGEALANMAKTVPNSGGILGDFFGENDLKIFADGLVDFGKALVGYSEVVSGNIDAGAIEASATAGEALTKLADTVPNSGGLLGDFFGENDLKIFADGLVDFGKALAGYSAEVSGGKIDTEAITASATAGEALTTLADTVPNSGGLLGAFFGENDMESFATDITAFGAALSDYSDAVKDIDSGAIENSTIAGGSLVALYELMKGDGKSFLDKIFGSDFDCEKFRGQIVPFGETVKAYSMAVLGVSPLAVENSIIAADVILALGEKLESFEGLDAFFSGTYDTVSNKLVSFGQIMADYSRIVATVNVAAIIGSATAADSLVALADKLPDANPVSEFLGTSYTNIQNKLIPFANIMKQYSDIVATVNIAAISGSVNAANALVSLAERLPSANPVVDFFGGSYTNISLKLIPFATMMKQYSDIVSTVNVLAISGSITAANALVTLAERLPNANPVSDFFGGGFTNISLKLLPFAQTMVDYGNLIAGLNTELIVKSTLAGDALISLATKMPQTTSLSSFFGGGTMTQFGLDLVAFGTHLKDYSDMISGVNIAVLTGSTNAADALVALANGITTVGPTLFKDGTMEGFGKDLKSFGTSLKQYASDIADVSTSQMNAVSYELRTLTAVAKGMEPVNSDAMGKFGTNLAKIGDAGITKFIRAFRDSTTRVKAAGAGLVNDLISGVSSKTSTLYALINQIIMNCNNSLTDKSVVFSSTGKKLIYSLSRGMYDNLEYVRSSCRTAVSQAEKEIQKSSSMINAGRTMATKLANGISNNRNSIIYSLNGALNQLNNTASGYYTAMYYSGKHLVQGFANGILNNRYLAVNAAGSMAALAVNKARKELNINSPSRVLKEVGGYFSEGFAIGISNNSGMSEKASAEMANKAKNSLKDAISQIPSLMSNIDDQPTIRPVLDLSNIQNGIDFMNNHMPSTYNASVNGSTKFADMAASGINKARTIAVEAKEAMANNMNQTISNTFNISGDNPREIANEVSKILQKQVNRKGSVWA